MIDKEDERHAYDSVNYGNYSGASEMLRRKPDITFNSNLESLPIPSQWRGGSQGDITTPVTLGIRPVERPNPKKTQMAPWVKRFQPKIILKQTGNKSPQPKLRTLSPTMKRSISKKVLNPPRRLTRNDSKTVEPSKPLTKDTGAGASTMESAETHLSHLRHTPSYLIPLPRRQRKTL